MFVSTATSVIGGGLLRPVGQTLSRFGKVVRNYGDDVYKVGASFTDDLIVAGYITAPMVSRPVRMEIIGGAIAGLVYDIAYGKSPDVRSERNASDVTSGGTSSGEKPMLSDSTIRWMLQNQPYSRDAITEHACGVGYRLVKRKGKFVCVKK